MRSSLLVAATFVIGALGHARVLEPAPRKSGAVSAAACGPAVTKSLTADLASPLEDAIRKQDSEYNAEACELYFCRGFKYEDNKSLVKKYSAGQVVPFRIDMIARHTGYANVSVIDLQAKKPIGSPLVYWPRYFDNTLGFPNWPKNETEFSVSIPSNLPTACKTAGNCALQWWWYAAYDNKQHYMNCIDFTV